MTRRRQRISLDAKPFTRAAYSRLRRRSRAQPPEPLEERLCLSVFYDLDILTQFGGFPSVNNAGHVAVAGGVGPPPQIYVNDGSAHTPITGNTDVEWFYGPVQINDHGQVASIEHERIIDEDGGEEYLYRAKIWDAENPGDSQLIARANTSSSQGPDEFFTIEYPASMSNDGYLAFMAEKEFGDPFQDLHLTNHSIDSGDPATLVESVPRDLAAARYVAGDGGKVLLATQDPTDVSIDLLDAGGGALPIVRTSAEWTLYSRWALGMSDDASVVVWVGERGKGHGVFASVAEPGGGRRTIAIAGEADTNGSGSFEAMDKPAPELGYDATGKPIYFQGFETSQPLGVAVFQNPGGDPDAIDPGESFIVSFIGTPSGGSRNNPITGQPLLFSNQTGLWTVHVRADAPLSGGGPTEYHKTSAHPVIQFGDKIDGEPIYKINTWDPISVASRNLDGTPRSRQAGDHYLAFNVQTTIFNQIVIRATQLDSDGDGLFDHWERDGIDVDRDGAVDLNLAVMGAQVLRKDLFLEVDWLKDDTPTANPANHRTFAPDPAAIDFLVNTFAAAPVANPDLTMGITVHVDGGPGLNQNMGAGNLQGGDEIAQAGSGNHIHVLYFAQDGSVTFPGQVDAHGRPIVTRSVENVKENFFGSTDKWARELAFRYVVFGDRHSTPATGSSGRGEITRYSSTSKHTMPGNDFVVTLQGMLDPPTLAVPPGGPAGTPATIPTPPGFQQGQTLVHELGHTLGLRHGGVDGVTTTAPNYASHVPARYRPNYRSLMNYAYQFGVSPDGTLVRSYSGPGDAVFDDWSNIQLGFSRYFDNLGNTLGKLSRTGAAPPFADIDEPDVDEFLEVNDPERNEPDLSGSTGNDKLTIRASDDGEMLLIYDAIPPAPGSEPIFTWPMNVATPLSIDTLAGDDVIAIELPDGTDGPVGGIRLDAGSGMNHVLHSGGRLRMDSVATSGSLDITVTGGAELITSGFKQVSLSIADEGTRATIRPGGFQASLLTSLAIGEGATLDISDNALVIDYTGDSPLADIRELILSGRGGPGFGTSWNGAGITSSTAAAANAAEPESFSVAYAENALLPLGAFTNFRGRAVDDTTILIAYTRTGDANLDGLVGDDDVTIVGATYAPGESKAQWHLGDFDFGGFVDDEDVTLLGAFYDPLATPLAAPSPPLQLAKGIIPTSPNASRDGNENPRTLAPHELLAETIASDFSRRSLKIGDAWTAARSAHSKVFAFWPV